MDRKFVFTGLTYAIVGMVLGIFMAASRNHGEFVTHAHVMLVGFVVSFIYGLCHKLWLNNNTSLLSRIQFYLHQAGAVVLSIGLFLYYGGFVELDTVDPVLAAASIAVLIAMVLMVVLFARQKQAA
jgi:putative solute:sodium symporter small subunit